jgi:hypothetical protein
MKERPTVPFADRPLSPPTWTMPQDVQPELPDLPSSDSDNYTAGSQLLDVSSLNTVLDMLAVIDSAEDLALLELLTVAQKRQVWDATPAAIKLRLKQIRSATSPDTAPETTAPETTAALEATALETPEPQAKLQEAAAPDHSMFQQGDRVILIAKSQLTAAEMKAVWEVVKIEAEQAHVKTPGLSDRQYPLAWMIRYPH